MRRQLAIIALGALLTALLSVEVSSAQEKQQCIAAMPSNLQGRWWSYRLIDGRKCWYEGKPGLSKSLLEWPKEVSARPAPVEEDTSRVLEKPSAPPDSPSWTPNSKAWAPTDPATLNSQAWAPTNPATFETRWRDRAAIAAPAPPEEAASVTDARPATPEVDHEPSLKKTDRLQLPYIDSSQAKVVHTLVITPDPPPPTTVGRR
jgi:hypothetical protein